MKQVPVERYVVLYLPWLLAWIFSVEPVWSYFIAWLGSFLIFYLSMSGWIKAIPEDRTIPEQLMRPIFLNQIIFAGYMCCTTLFYFLDVLGYKDFARETTYVLIEPQRLELLAQCQRYYSLAHAAFVTGMLLFMSYPKKQQYHISTDRLANLILRFALIALPASIILRLIPGLSQFAVQFNALSFIAGTLALAFAIPLKKSENIIIAFILYASNVYTAFISGFKEPIIISILILGIFLYPTYKKLVFVVFVPLLLSLFVLLPTYNRVFRANAWSGDTSAEDASRLALDAVLNGNNTKDETNWEFLVFRLSEVDMFTKYVQSTPANIDFYGFKLIKQAIEVIVPRIVWPNKPITEDLVMERVYDAGVIYRGVTVSAKPPLVVDAYLSGGNIGIFLTLLIFGITVQLINLKAEKLFGGYILGTAMVFAGLFQIMWRGLSFEFLINAIFWSYVTMLIVFQIALATRILKRV
ncbi:MAG: exosortase Y-associated Wzy-like protein [Sphingobacteriaceae bacterium]